MITTPAPEKNVPTGVPAQEPVQPQQTPNIPGSPPGTTFGPETDEQRRARLGVEPARKQEPPYVIEPPAIPVPAEVAERLEAPQRGNRVR